jgi:hypothetical protein
MILLKDVTGYLVHRHGLDRLTFTREEHGQHAYREASRFAKTKPSHIMAQGPNSTYDPKTRTWVRDEELAEQ